LSDADDAGLESSPLYLPTVNDWVSLPPVAQLPLPYRAWAWWLRHGPKRANGGTVGGTFAFRALVRAAALITRRAHAFVTLRAKGHPAITLDARDFETFHHALPVWYRGDTGLALLTAIVRPGDVYVDVGANYGTYALPIAQDRSVRVIAVEPQPQLAEALRRSVAANAFPNVDVIEAALSDYEGGGVLATGAGSGSATFHHQRQAFGSAMINVPVMRLDDLAAELNLNRLDCLKIDVEGAEIDVLKGGAATIARHHPAIVFEVGAKERQQAVFEWLRGAGYTRFADQGSTQGRQSVMPRLNAALTNVVALRESNADEILRRIVGSNV
jgi:FkbM family methyltransferase